MIMDSYYSWNQPEHIGPAQKLWSKVYNDTLKEKIIIQNQSNIPHLANYQYHIPIYSTFSQNIRDSWHNPPLRIDDYDMGRSEKEEKNTKLSVVSQLIQLIKKKRDYNKASVYGYEIQIQIGMISTHSSDLYPWNVAKKMYEKNINGLNEEVLDFYRYIMPSEEEQFMRQEVIARLTKVVHNEWPDAEVDVFGSFKTELHLPTSDIDVVIFGSWENPLWKLNDIIKRSGIASDCKVLDKATVPIVKMTDKDSDVRIDISFNMSNGKRSADLIKSYINHYPQLPQLVLLLKQYLLQRDLNEVWTGGISSYSLILMCVSFMKDCSKKKLDTSCNLGKTLILFLEMYGRNFDYTNTGIRTVGDISYVPKEEIMKNMDGNQWSSILCIEDPLNPGNDIGRSSYGALHVKLAFDYAYSNLVPVVLCQSSHLFEDHKSILGRIIRITPEVIKYRAMIKKKYSGCHVQENTVSSSKKHTETSKEANTNNHNQKCNIGERGDMPGKNDITVSTYATKLHKTSYPSYKKAVMNNQVRTSALSNSNNSRTPSQVSVPHKMTEQVPSNHFKKNKTPISVNCGIDRD